MAKILDLDGKYYGTVIELNDKFQNEITIWLEGGNKVSQRELDNGWTRGMGLTTLRQTTLTRLLRLLKKHSQRQGIREGN